MRTLRSYLALPVVASLLLMCGCGGSGSNSNELPDPTVRFANLSPDVTLDYFTDDDSRATNIGFGATSASFNSLDPAERDVSTRATGSSIELTNDLFSFQRDTNTLIVSYGLNNFGTENEKRLQTAFVNVDRKTPNGTKSRVIAFNAYVRATGDGNIPIVFKDSITNPSITFSAINFGGSNVKELDAGQVTLFAQQEGTDNQITSVTKTLEAGKIYLMYLGGIDGSAGATTPSVQFIELQTR